jgi:two-component system response regulator FixJ
VVVYGCGDVALAVAAMKLGAADVLDWPVRWTALAEAVDRALLADGGERTPAPPMSALSMCRVSTLSPRQRDVLQGLMAGKVNKTIARQLGVSPRTVECHRAALMARTGAHSLSDLIRIGIAAGL